MAFDPKQVNTAEENANTYADKVDLAFANAGVTTKEGNPMLVSRLAGSPTWLLALAHGSVASEWQERCRKAYYSLDPANCDADQVLNLAMLAGVVSSYADTPYTQVTVENPYDYSIYLNSTNCEFVDTGTDSKWYLGQGINLAPGYSMTVLIYCSKHDVSIPVNTSLTLKSLTVPAAFDDLSVTTEYDSRLEGAEKSIAQLRNDIQLGYENVDVITQCQNAIARLNGIRKCSIFFNEDPTNAITLPGSINLPARKAFVCIEGADTDDLLAQTYYKYMNVATIQGPNYLASNTRVGANDHEVYYSQAQSQMCYIKVTVKAYGSDLTYQQRIKDILLEHSGTMAVGEDITSQLVNEWLANLGVYVKVLDADVSMDGTTYGVTTAVDANKYLMWDAAHIVFNAV